MHVLVKKIELTYIGYINLSIYLKISYVELFCYVF